MTHATMTAIDSIRSLYAGEVIGYGQLEPICRAANTTVRTMTHYGVIAFDHSTVEIEEVPEDELEYDCPECGEDNYDAARGIYIFYHTQAYYRITEA